MVGESFYFFEVSTSIFVHLKIRVSYGFIESFVLIPVIVLEW